MTDSPLGLAQQSDWPNPQVRLSRQDFQLRQPFTLRKLDKFPPGRIGADQPNDLSLPIRRDSVANARQFHLQIVPRSLQGTDKFPPGIAGGISARNVENPLLPRRFAHDAGQAPATLYFGSPFANLDWPNPTAPRRFAHDVGSAPATLFFGSPFSNQSWPNPIGSPRQILGAGFGAPLALQAINPFPAMDWPLPAPASRGPYDVGAAASALVLSQSTPPIPVGTGLTQDAFVRPKVVNLYDIGAPISLALTYVAPITPTPETSVWVIVVRPSPATWPGEAANNNASWSLEPSPGGTWTPETPPTSGPWTTKS